MNFQEIKRKRKIIFSREKLAWCPDCVVENQMIQCSRGFTLPWHLAAHQERLTLHQHSWEKRVAQILWKKSFFWTNHLLFLLMRVFTKVDHNPLGLRIFKW